MKAAALHRIGAPLRIENVPEPRLGPEEVLIETRTCGICRTDLHIQDGLAYIPELPHIPGHEPAGVVAAVGERVERVTVGQRVVPHLFVTCGECRYCRTGREAQCSDVKDALALLAAGVIRPPIGGRFPLEQLNDALQLMRDNRAQGRLIIKLK